jgi:hypothetical protein
MEQKTTQRAEKVEQAEQAQTPDQAVFDIPELTDEDLESIVGGEAYRLIRGASRQGERLVHATNTVAVWLRPGEATIL